MKKARTEAFCGGKQLQTIMCNCCFAFRLPGNSREKKNKKTKSKATQTKVEETPEKHWLVSRRAGKHLVVRASLTSGFTFSFITFYLTE